MYVEQEFSTASPVHRGLDLHETFMHLLHGFYVWLAKAFKE